MRLVQHKAEAFWFYRFLSIFYDNYVNPLFWTVGMRERSLTLAKLDSQDLETIDVGSGTGFTTEGIAKKINPTQIHCIDQSPHQMYHAKKKSALNGCHFQTGDAENLPFEDDRFDRYVSAGSIEYWPDPQRGIAESYRVIKPGGLALMIGPLRPENWLGRWLADTWMLFPEESEYLNWYEKAGFVNIRKVYVAPKWVLKENYGIALVGEKPAPGPSPIQYNASDFEPQTKVVNSKHSLLFFWRLIAGSLAGFFFIPMALVGYARYKVLALFGKKPQHPETNKDRLPTPLITVLIFIAFIISFLIIGKPFS